MKHIDEAMSYTPERLKHPKTAKVPKAYRLLNDMVLVKRLEAEAKSEIEKGMFDVTGKISNQATVVSICPTEVDLKVGDKVVFSEHAANDIELDGANYLLLQRRQVYIIL